MSKCHLSLLLVTSSEILKQKICHLFKALMHLKGYVLKLPMKQAKAVRPQQFQDSSNFLIRYYSRNLSLVFDLEDWHGEFFKSKNFNLEATNFKTVC
jgi:hypothetical protein